MAKTFKARFQQLIAPLSSWTTGDKKDFKILPGEIAFATAAISGVKNGTEPVVLLKVNNTNAEATWEDLEYTVYANAQDVHAWAKAAGITVEDKGTGTVISKIKWEDDILIVERRGLTNDDLNGLTIGNALHANAAGQVDHSFTVIGKSFDGSATQSVTAQEVYDAIKDLVAADDANDNTTYTLSGANNKIILTPSEGDADEIEVVGAGAASVTVDGDKITVDVSKEASETEAGLLSATDKAKIDKLVVNPDGTIGGTIEKAGTAEKVEHSITVLGESFNGSAEVEITADEIYNAIADKDENETFTISYNKDEKKIFLTGSDGTNSEIPTDDFIKDGMIESVVLSEDGKSLVITWNTDAGKEQSVTNIALSALVDVYTGGTTDDIIVDVSDENVITAVLTKAIKDELAKARTFAAGAVLDVEDKDGVITYSHEAIAAPTGTAGSGRTYLTGVSTDGHGHITGFTTATESDQTIPEYTLVGAESGFVEAGGNTIAYSVELKKDGTTVGAAVTHEIVATGAYDRMNNPLALKDYVDDAVKEVADDLDGHNHKIEELDQVEYVIFNANF